MDIKNYILRLKSTEYKYSEARKISEEIQRKPLTERVEILGEFVNEKQKSDNSDIIDVINVIVSDLSSKK